MTYTDAEKMVLGVWSEFFPRPRDWSQHDGTSSLTAWGSWVNRDRVSETVLRLALERMAEGRPEKAPAPTLFHVRKAYAQLSGRDVPTNADETYCHDCQKHHCPDCHGTRYVELVCRRTRDGYEVIPFGDVATPEPTAHLRLGRCRCRGTDIPDSLWQHRHDPCSLTGQHQVDSLRGVAPLPAGPIEGVVERVSRAPASVLQDAVQVAVEEEVPF